MAADEDSREHGERDQGVGEGVGGAAAQQAPEHPPGQPTRVGAQQEGDRRAEQQQWRGHQLDQQVLHHVRAERAARQNIRRPVGGDKDDQEPHAERDREAERPADPRRSRAQSPPRREIGERGHPHADRRGGIDLPGGEHVQDSEQRDAPLARWLATDLPGASSRRRAEADRCASSGISAEALGGKGSHDSDVHSHQRDNFVMCGPTFRYRVLRFAAAGYRSLPGGDTVTEPDTKQLVLPGFETHGEPGGPHGPEGGDMKAVGIGRPDAQRLRKQSRLIVILVVGCVLLALGACAKGGGKEEKKGAAPAGIPTYRVSVSKFTYEGMPDTVPANKPFNIVFTNKESFDITHELVVLGIPSGKTLQDVVAAAKAKGPDGEGGFLGFGEIADVDTAGTGVHTFDLPPGKYALTCWEDGKAGGGTGPVHASIGMAKEFTAAESAKAPAAAAAPKTYQVSVSKFTYEGMPDTVPANKPFNIVFTNKESFDITHELVVLGIPSGKTLQDVVAAAKAKGPDGEGGFLGFGEIADVDTAGTGVHTFDLPPGKYALTCWEDGKAGGGTGPVHASIGMAKEFTVS